MTLRNRCSVAPTSRTATVLCLRSRTARMRPLANNSKHPTCWPARITIGLAFSISRTRSGTNCRSKSASPELSAFSRRELRFFASLFTYWTSVNPSARNNSSATYLGALHVPPAHSNLILVVSNGGSAPSRRGWAPRNPAVPAMLRSRTNARRLQPLRPSLMEVPPPDRRPIPSTTLPSRSYSRPKAHRITLLGQNPFGILRTHFHSAHNDQRQRRRLGVRCTLRLGGSVHTKGAL